MQMRVFDPPSVNSRHPRRAFIDDQFLEGGTGSSSWDIGGLNSASIRRLARIRATASYSATLHRADVVVSSAKP